MTSAYLIVTLFTARGLPCTLCNRNWLFFAPDLRHAQRTGHLFPVPVESPYLVKRWRSPDWLFPSPRSRTSLQLFYLCSSFPRLLSMRLDTLPSHTSGSISGCKTYIVRGCGGNDGLCRLWCDTHGNWYHAVDSRTTTTAPPCGTSNQR